MIDSVWIGFLVASMAINLTCVFVVMSYQIRNDELAVKIMARDMELRRIHNVFAYTGAMLVNRYGVKQIDIIRLYDSLIFDDLEQFDDIFPEFKRDKE